MDNNNNASLSFILNQSNQSPNNSNNFIIDNININNNNNNNENEENELITKIPREVWIHILSYLNERDLMNVSFVDSFLYQISQDNFLWKPLYLKKWNVITLPHKKRISIDKNLNQKNQNKRINTNNNSNSNRSNNSNSNIPFNDFNDNIPNNSFNSLFNNNINNISNNINNSSNNNNNSNSNNSNNNNNNNEYLNFNNSYLYSNNQDLLDNNINQNLNNFVQKIFKPKLNIYNIDNNDSHESFMNHLPIWKSLYRERKLIFKESGIEEFYHLLETLIAYPLEFNRKAMMSMYTLVFQLCIVNYRMMNYVLPPTDLYRMLVECCHNHLTKCFNESSLYEDGPQLIEFYLHHWNNYIHSIKRINIVFSYFHRDWISKQGETGIIIPSNSFTLKGNQCWWNRMLNGNNASTDPISFIHLTTMMARGWYTVFFSQLQFDEYDYYQQQQQKQQQSQQQQQQQQQQQHSSTPSSSSSNTPNQPQQSQQFPNINNSSSINTNNGTSTFSSNNQSIPNNNTKNSVPSNQKFNRLLGSLDKCKDKNDFYLITSLLKSMLQLHEFLIYTGDESTTSNISNQNNNNIGTTYISNNNYLILHRERETNSNNSNTSNTSNFSNSLFSPIYNILKTYNPNKHHCTRENPIDFNICTNNNNSNNSNNLYNLFQRHYQNYQSGLFSIELGNNDNSFNEFQQFQHNQQNNAFSFPENYNIYNSSNNHNNPINDNTCQFCNVFTSNPPVLCDEKMNKLLKKCYSILLIQHISFKKK